MPDLAPIHYLDRMSMLGLIPNFWCSLEYWRRAGIRFTEAAEGSFLASDSDGELFLPILHVRGPLPGVEVFAGFPDMDGAVVVDRQYIYTPGLPDMKGTTWKPLRSTMRRVDRLLGSLRLCPLRPGEEVKRSAQLLFDWSLTQGDQVYDPELMTDFVLNGDNRLALWDDRNVLWGIMVWDSNYKYTNFRYCVVSQEVDGLSDVARLLFREWCGIHHPNRLINDGGDLDRSGLRRYKMKFHPHEVHIIRGKAT